MPRPSNGIWHESERRFAKFLEAKGVDFIPHPRPPFRLGIIKYTPDFYLPAEKTYVEVVGSRQALQQNLPKILRVVSHYKICLKFYTSDGQERPLGDLMSRNAKDRLPPIIRRPTFVLEDARDGRNVFLRNKRTEVGLSRDRLAALMGNVNSSQIFKFEYMPFDKTPKWYYEKLMKIISEQRASLLRVEAGEAKMCPHCRGNGVIEDLEK